mgnify:FL=1|tara:strand:+ start:640 stop:1146 length:507 start_codon:yes stop_codon:yes gene_type:complete
MVIFFCCSDEQASSEQDLECDGFLSDTLKNFANLNWSLNNWVSNWLIQPSGTYGTDNFIWTDYPDLVSLKGDYSLTLILTGELRDTYGSYISSDSLESFPYWASNSSVSVLRDSLFYEYIRQHNQFTGGWYDVATSWYATFQFVDGKSKDLILSPVKREYREMYYDCE